MEDPTRTLPHPGERSTLAAVLGAAGSIAETLGEPILVLGLDLRVRLANTAFCEQFQACREELVGRVVYEVPRGEWGIPPIRTLLEEQVLPGSHVSHGLEVRHTFAADQERVLLLTARRLDPVPLVALAVRDVTAAEAGEALRESAERLRLFGEASSDVLWIRGADDLQWEYLSPAFETIYGYQRAQVMGNDDLHRWAQLIVPDDREGALTAISQVRSGERVTFEYRIQRSDGEIRWLRNTDFPIVDEHGTVRRIGGVGHDVTDQKNAEKELRAWSDTLEQRVEERTAELAESNRALGREIEQRERAEAARSELLRQLVNAEERERRRISYELHDQMAQHLTGLLLGLRTAQGETERPGLAERLRGLEHLAGETARDLQSMAVELRPPALDTLGLVAAVQNHLEDWSARHEIEHDFYTRGLQGVRLPNEIETTLYRVVQEGLTNAVRHGRATRVSLTLDRRDGVVRAILEDDGGGFDVEGTLTRPEKARRLGIRGMRERVALLGGELELESEPGRGTTIYVRLPALEPALREPATA